MCRAGSRRQSANTSDAGSSFFEGVLELARRECHLELRAALGGTQELAKSVAAIDEHAAHQRILVAAAAARLDNGERCDHGHDQGISASSRLNP
jgi:hypothetical protein